MTMRFWIRKLLARPVAQPLRKRPHRARLAVEALEQRWVPSFTVTNLLDNGSAGSLRWAVGQANATGGDETIDFDPTVFATPQTIPLTGTQLELTDTTGTETITGPAVGVTVNGNNASRVFQIDAGVTASFSGLTIRGGHTTGNGGGILNTGTLSLTDCTVSANSALAGGGLNNTGTLTLTNCTVSGNSATSNVFPAPGGGGLTNLAGTLTLTDCTISGNSARTWGGGVYGSNGSTTTLTDCTVSGNSAGRGGGLEAVGGTTTLTDCTVSGNSAGYFGGGVESFGSTMNLTDCTISGNSAGNLGGGVSALYGDTVTLTDCTVSGNSASQGGGGLESYYGAISLSDCTVSDNSAGNLGGGGLHGGAVLHNTLIAGNVRHTGMTRDDVSGFLRGDYNLIGDGTGMGGISNGVNGNLVGSAAAPIDPLLAPLGYYGGPTQTMALLPGSSALDAGAPNQLGSTDQRGVVRSGGVNIGAYQASATTFVVRAPDTVQSGVPFDVTVTAVDPFNQVAVGYTGTVTFGTTDTDPGVVLPADYAFVPGDGGMHTFTDTGLGEVTLVTPGDQMLTGMDTADNTITSSIVITVSAGPAPPPSTVPARTVQGKAPAPSQPSASEVVGLERWFAWLHDGDYVWMTAPRLNHQARGDTTLGMADLFGGDDLLFA